MAKRIANKELNHDNWDDEDEAEEAGTFKQADNETLQGRVIKKAKRRGLANQDGGPSIFAGFGGFKPSADLGSTTKPGGGAGAFDFLAKNGSSSTDSPASKASFSFKSPENSSNNSGFTFGAPKTDSENGTDKSKGLFAFGSANAKPAFGSFGASSNSVEKATFSFTSKSEETSKKSESTENETSTKSLKDLFKPKEGSWKCSVCDIMNDGDKVSCVACTTPKPGGDNAGAKKNAIPAPVTSSLPPLKAMVPTGNWSCPDCMVSNPADKDNCLCCSAAKPGSKSKAAAAAPAFNPGSVTTSGFKFGGSDTPTSGSTATSGFKFGSTSSNSESSTTAKPTGFQFGSNDSSSKKSTNEKSTKSESSEKKYSKEFLSHLKALNNQVTAWIKTHVEKNPYVFLTPVFKDYEKHLKDLETKYPSTSGASSPPKSSPATENSSASKPLLGAVFGAPSTKPTEEVKFGTTSGFAFGSSGSEKPKSSVFGSASTTENSSQKEESGIFSAKSTTEIEKQPSTGFTFGSATTTDKKETTGFSFGSKTGSEDKPASGFTFGTSSTTTSGFAAFGSTAPTFGSSGTTGFSFGATSGATSGSNAESENKTEEGDEDEPPKVEVNQVVEDDAFHSVRCKLFYKKDKEFADKGLGMLHLKKVDGGKTQLLVRAETNLGNILLNILVNDQMNILKRKNNIQFACIPNPAIKGVPDGPVMMLVKVKDALMADQLEEKLKEAMKS